MAKYKTFKKEALIYGLLSVVAYFLPIIIVSACLFPFMEKADAGLKVAMGIVIVIINAIPFLMGIFRAFFAHFPMLNILAFVFLALGAFFTLDIFKEYVSNFLFIEFAAAVGSIASCIFWSLHRKYKQYSLSVAATIKSGAFKTKE